MECFGWVSPEFTCTHSYYDDVITSAGFPRKPHNLGDKMGMAMQGMTMSRIPARLAKYMLPWLTTGTWTCSPLSSKPRWFIQAAERAKNDLGSVFWKAALATFRNVQHCALMRRLGVVTPVKEKKKSHLNTSMHRGKWGHPGSQITSCGPTERSEARQRTGRTIRTNVPFPLLFRSTFRVHTAETETTRQKWWVENKTERVGRHKQRKWMNEKQSNEMKITDEQEATVSIGTVLCNLHQRLPKV